MGEGVSFSTEPARDELEITGPVALKIWLSSTTADADIFATLRLFGPDDREVTFVGANDPAVPVTQGWLRASHRALAHDRTLEWRPWHSHRAAEPLTPGVPVLLQVELWPTSIVLPKGYRLELLVAGRDFQRPTGSGPLRGSGPFLHTDPVDRDPSVFGGQTTLYAGGKFETALLLPVIPEVAA
jgi:predicted acyl esterase